MTDQDPTQPLPHDPAPGPQTPLLPSQAATSAPPSPPVAWAPPAPHDPLTPPAGGVAPLAQVSAARPGRGGPLRWIVALVVVALVVAGGLGATLLLTGASGASTVLAYTPADSIGFIEGRLDLPGGQRAEIAKTLSAFPGFADQAALNAKLGELLDRLVRAASDGKQDYQTDIAPWFGGQLAVAQGRMRSSSETATSVGSLPACTGGSSASPAPEPSGGSGPLAADVRALVLANTTDSAKADAWVRSVLSEGGATMSDLTCDGVAVHLVTPPPGVATDVRPAGWAIIAGKVLAVGDLDSIRLSIATGGTSGLNTVASFGKAAAALPGDHLAFMWQDTRTTLGSALGSIPSVGGAGPAKALLDLVDALVPDWTAASLTASGGNLVLSTVQPAPVLVAGSNRASDLAAMAPASTVLLVDAHDVGKTLLAIHDKAKADPELKQYVGQLDAVLGLVGGLSGGIGWIGDAGVALTRDASGVSGGVLIRPDDAGAAQRLLEQLRSLVSLAGAGSQIPIRDEAYNGETITSVDLSALLPVVGDALPGRVPTLPGVGVPSQLTLVYTATDRAVVLTVDPAFAKGVIDASKGGDSLLKSARFTALLGGADRQVTGLAWLDATAVRELAETLMPADERAKYDADIRPYLLPVDALLATTTVDGDLQRSTTTLSIKH